MLMGSSSANRPYRVGEDVLLLLDLAGMVVTYLIGLFFIYHIFLQSGLGEKNILRDQLHVSAQLYHNILGFLNLTRYVEHSILTMRFAPGKTVTYLIDTFATALGRNFLLLINLTEPRVTVSLNPWWHSLKLIITCVCAWASSTSMCVAQLSCPAGDMLFCINLWPILEQQEIKSLNSVLKMLEFTFGTLGANSWKQKEVPYTTLRFSKCTATGYGPNLYTFRGLYLERFHHLLIQSAC